MRSISLPSYNPFSKGITTGELLAASFNIVGPAVGVVATAANASLFAAIGKAMIVARTIIAAIVVVFLFVFVFFGVTVSTMKKRVSNHDNKEGYEFHLWIPQVVSTFGICLYLNIKELTMPPYRLTKLRFDILNSKLNDNEFGILFKIDHINAYSVFIVV
jgi:hypothetical protein